MNQIHSRVLVLGLSPNPPTQPLPSGFNNRFPCFLLCFRGFKLGEGTDLGFVGGRGNLATIVVIQVHDNALCCYQIVCIRFRKLPPTPAITLKRLELFTVKTGIPDRSCTQVRILLSWLSFGAPIEGHRNISRKHRTISVSRPTKGT